MASEAAYAAPQWRPEDDPDYGRRMLSHLFARYLWLIALGAVLGGLIFLVVSLRQPRIYSAEASLQINKSAGASGAGGASLAPLLGSGPDLLGEIEVLRSRQILGPVIEELNLQVDVYDLQAPDSSLRTIQQRLGLADPLSEDREQLFTRLQVSSVLVDDELIKSVTYEIEGLEGGGWRIGDQAGQAGERAALNHVSFTPVFGTAHEPGFKYLLVVHPAQTAYENFRKSLATQITSDVVHLSLRYHNPVICARAVNELVTQYLERYGTSKGTDFGVVLSFIDDEAAKRQQRIKEITDELNRYQQEQGTYLPSAQGGAAISTLSALEQQQAQNQIQLANLNNVLGNWRQRSPEDIYESIQAPATDLAIEQTLVTELANVIGNLQSARLTKTERHPDVIALKGAIESQIGLIRDALVTSRNALATASERIGGEIARQRALLRALPEAENRIFMLTSELEVSSEILSRLKQSQIDTQLRQASVEREARVLDFATVPVKKDAPRVGRNAIVGAVAGAVVIALLALLVEALNRRMKSLREVRLGAGLPILGVLPNGRLGRWVPRERNPLLFKRLASFLEADGKVLGIVHLPFADTSFELAWGLAGAIADATGQPAVLVDGDRMDAALCAALNQEPRHTLTDAAAGEVDVDRALMQLDERRWLLQLGMGRIDDAALAPAFAMLRETFSCVIVCLPPPLQWNGQEELLVGQTLLSAMLDEGATQTRVSAPPLVDSVVISLPQGVMLLEELRENVAELRALGIEPDGAVITNYASRRDVLGRDELRFAAVRPSGRV